MSARECALESALREVVVDHAHGNREPNEATLARARAALALPADAPKPVEAFEGHTPGPWEVFICDDGGEWTGWPLSVNPVENAADHAIVRPGGFYPYAWDEGISQKAACANARLIAAAPTLAADNAALRERVAKLENALEECRAGRESWMRAATSAGVKP